MAHCHAPPRHPSLQSRHQSWRQNFKIDKLYLGLTIDEAINSEGETKARQCNNISAKVRKLREDSIGPRRDKYADPDTEQRRWNICHQTL